MSDSLSRFIGDSPARVLVRLVILSFVVGVVLAALGLEPFDIVNSVIRFGEHIWEMGFSAIDRAWRYFLLGAVVVVPVWLVLRLLQASKR
jgi:hypothetical protein